MTDDGKEKAAARILIVEDEGILAEDLGLSLENLGYSVEGKVSTGREAVKPGRGFEARFDLDGHQTAGRH